MSSNTGNSGSSIDAAVKYATGAAQNVYNSLTGDTQAQREGMAKQDQGSAEHEDSKTVGKVGNVSATPQGGVAVDDSRRTEGSWDQTLGSGKEFVGGLLGSEGLKQQGQDQRTGGQQKEAAGQVSDYASGVGDRVKGFGQQVGGALTGDTQTETQGQQQRVDGKAAQRGVEADLQKQADADRQ